MYKQENPTDMRNVPKSRYDLLKVDRYASGALQFSRGCPFQCEFCDIIVTLAAAAHQASRASIEELDEMRRVGFFSCFIVDDNFIGNKKDAKALLRLIIPWQQKHGYPLRLTTEASVNLADDAELLELLYQANFRSVFIGIETPRGSLPQGDQEISEHPRRFPPSQARADSQRRDGGERGVHRRFRQRRQDDF